MRNLVFVFVVLSLFAFFGCSHADRVELLRLDRVLSLYSRADSLERDSLRQKYADELTAWMSLLGSHLSDSALLDCSRSRSMEVFGPDVESRFDVSDSISEIISILESFRLKLFEDSAKMNYCAVVSPYRQSIYINDRYVFIALNHYLGVDYEGYSAFDSYQLMTKNPKYLPYDVAEAIVMTKYPYKRGADDKVLNVLLYHGAVIAAVMELVPNSSLTEALGYDGERMEWLACNESEVWNALVSRQLLYSSSLIDADRLVRPSPSTSLLHVQCPGRVGRYIGYRIVEQYINNEDVPIRRLLSREFYGDSHSLVKSGYSGGN